MSKYKKLYDVLKCDINIPTNDVNAWLQFPEYRWVYNKMFLCQYQNIDHAPMPIIPCAYPVILKPITNLYGMGLNIKKINNEEEFYNMWYNNNFWMEYLEGDHISWDIVILKGKVVYHACFMGYKSDIIGKFDYWESVEKSILPIIKKLIEEKLSDYSGCFNVETINNKIIESHLRMGDIDIFPTKEILNGIIAAYKKEEYDWNIKYNKTFFFPVWTENNSDFTYAKKNIGPLLEKNAYVYDYNIDTDTLSSPSDKYKRLMWFTCGDKDYGMLLRKSIYENVDKNK